VKKGVNFTANIEKPETDLTAEMISRSAKLLFTSGVCHG